MNSQNDYLSRKPSSRQVPAACLLFSILPSGLGLLTLRGAANYTYRSIPIGIIQPTDSHHG